MLNSGNTLKFSIGMLFVDAIAPVLGAVATLFFSIESYFLVFMLSFLAGSFLYMGGGNLLPDAYRMNRPVVTTIFFALGFMLVILLTTTL
jgi:ZIP family zinc transporter